MEAVVKVRLQEITFKGGVAGIGVFSSNTIIVSQNNIYDAGGATNNNAIRINDSDNTTVTGNNITDTSATTTNYAINIDAATSDLNYLADNRFSSTPGTSTINDAGTGTIYSNQPLAENGGFITTRTANSTAAFQIQNASSVSLFTVDSTNSRLYIGPAAGDTVGTVLVLGNKTNAGDPTGVEGAMYYNSSKKDFRCYANGGWKNCNGIGYETVEIEDEFLGGNGPVSGMLDQAGELSWDCPEDVDLGGACQTNPYDEETNHPGVMLITNNSTTLNRGGQAELRPVDPSVVDRMIFIVKTAPSAHHSNTELRIGLLQDAVDPGNSPTDGIYFSGDPSSSTYWRTRTRVSSVDTTNITTFTSSADTWFRLELVRNTSGNWEFYINGVLQYTHSTNLPTAMLMPTIQLNSLGNDHAEVLVDYFFMRSKPLTR